MWPSEMPTSLKRRGKRAANSVRPVPSFIAAVSATMRRSFSAAAVSAAPNASLQVVFRSADAAARASSGDAAIVNAPTPCHFSGSLTAGA